MWWLSHRVESGQMPLGEKASRPLPQLSSFHPRQVEFIAFKGPWVDGEMGEFDNQLQ